MIYIGVTHHFIFIRVSLALTRLAAHLAKSAWEWCEIGSEGQTALGKWRHVVILRGEHLGHGSMVERLRRLLHRRRLRGMAMRVAVAAVERGLSAEAVTHGSALLIEALLVLL